MRGVERQRLLRECTRLQERLVSKERFAALTDATDRRAIAYRACLAAHHLRAEAVGDCQVQLEVTWAGLRWLVYEYPHSIDGGPASEWASTTLVTLGDTTAELGDWCQALGHRTRGAVEELREGADPIRVLGRHGPRCATNTGLTVDEEVAAFLAEHPHGATLAEVGAWFGVSRERVRQIQESAFRRIRDRADPELAEDFFAHLADRVSWDDVHYGS